MNRLYKDMQEYFPGIFASMMQAYNEDINSSENIPRIAIRGKKSRNAAKRSSRKTAASKKVHYLESQINETIVLPDSEKTLLLRLETRLIEGELCFVAKTNIGNFWIRPKKYDDMGRVRLWIAEFSGMNRRNFQEAANPFGALAKLLGMTWAIHVMSGKELSLYDMYAGIKFVDASQPLRGVRNWTPKIREIDGFKWQI